MAKSTRAIDMFGKLSRYILKLWGFKITGVDVHAYPKKIFAVAPHTSNWDFPLGILVRSAMNLKIRFLGKDSLFKPPYGWIFRALGGIPVVRTKATNFVEDTVNTLNKYNEISLALAPEGTRKRVEVFRTGFYWMAVKSEIPLFLVKFDWGNKIVDFSGPFPISGNIEVDLPKIEEHFRHVQGKIPENFFLS